MSANKGYGLISELFMVDACDSPCQEDFLPGQRRQVPLTMTEMVDDW